jgi:hypothetical protein
MTRIASLGFVFDSLPKSPVGLRSLFCGFLLTLGACHHGGDPRQDFVGAWTNISGTSTQTCPGRPPDSTPLSPGDLALSIAHGASSKALVVSIPFGTEVCTIIADVVENGRATIEPNQHCVVNLGGTFSFKSGTLETPDGAMLSVVLTADQDAGQGTVCQAAIELSLGRPAVL